MKQRLKKGTSVHQPVKKKGNKPEDAPWLRFAPALITAAALMVYVSVLSFGLSWLDDVLLLKDRFFIINDIANLPLAFTSDAFLGSSGSFYRPLQTVTFMLEAFVGGEGYLVFHLTNLLLHIAVCCTLYWLLLTAGYRSMPSLILAALYAVHPVFVSTVAWIPSRGDQLLTLFTLFSVILFIRSFRTAHPAIPYLHALIFFLAFLSKETAVVIPVICLAYYVLEKPRSKRPNILRLYGLTWLGIIAVWAVLRMQLESVGLTGRVLGIEPFFKNLQMIPETVGKFLLPIHMRIIPQFNVIDTIMGLVAIVLLLFLIRRFHVPFNRRILFGFFWFLIFIVPVMTFRNNEAAYFFDYLYHRSYVTNIGLVIVIAEVLKHTRVIEKHMRRAAYVAGAVLLICAVQAYMDLQYYRDPLSFYSEALERSPGSAMCYNNRGSYVEREHHDHDAALRDYDKALELFPSYVTAMVGRGATYKKLGKFDLAMTDFQTALLVNPNHLDAIYNRGALRFLMNDYQGALLDYERVLKTNVLYPRIWSAKAGCLAMLDRPAEAMEFAEKAIETNPNDEQAYNSRGLARKVAGNFTGAMKDFNKALEVNPEYSRGYNNRGVIYFSMGEFQRAIDEFTRALQSDSLLPDAYNNRGSAKHRLQQLDEAMVDLDIAIRINPLFAAAYQNRGVVKNMLRRFPDAMQDFNRSIEINPNAHQPWFGRGITKYMMQDFSGCCEDWLRAKELGSPEAENLLLQYCQ